MICLNPQKKKGRLMSLAVGMALAPRRPQARVHARARNQVRASLIRVMICLVATGYYEASRTNMERRVIACVEAQLAEPLREDGPILGIEFDELPPGAFGAPIAPTALQHRYRHSYDNKSYGKYDAKQINASSNGPHEIIEPQVRSDAYRHVAPSYLYDSPVDDGSAAKILSIVHVNGHIPREYGVGGLVSSVNMITQSGRQFTSSPRNSGFIAHNDNNIQIDRKRKSDEVQIGREVQAHEKRLWKELEQQEILRKDMERQDREIQKESCELFENSSGKRRNSSVKKGVK